MEYRVSARIIGWVSKTVEASSVEEAIEEARHGYSMDDITDWSVSGNYEVDPNEDEERGDED